MSGARASTNANLPKHRRAVLSIDNRDLKNTARCAHPFNDSECEAPCPRHFPSTYARDAAKHRREVLSIDNRDLKNTARCVSRPYDSECEDAPCPRHFPSTYARDSAKHLGAGL